MSISVTETRTIPVDHLHAHPENARRGNVDVIRESLRAHGQYRAVVARELHPDDSGDPYFQLLAGHHVVQAARAEEWSDVLVSVVEADDDEARKIVLIDNRANDLAEYDTEALAAMLTAVEDLEGTGFDEDAVNAILNDAGRLAAAVDPFRTVDDGLKAEGVDPSGYMAPGTNTTDVVQLVLPATPQERSEVMRLLARQRDSRSVATLTGALLAVLREADAASMQEDV